MHCHLFVYGTLLEGESNHVLLAASGKKLRNAEVPGSLWDTGFGYPALVLGEVYERVHGEVYAIDGALLGRLDELEDFHGPGDPRNEYERVEVTARTESGPLRAWTYVYPSGRTEGLVRIAGGDWRAWCAAGTRLPAPNRDSGR